MSSSTSGVTAAPAPISDIVLGEFSTSQHLSPSDREAFYAGVARVASDLGITVEVASVDAVTPSDVIEMLIPA